MLEHARAALAATEAIGDLAAAHRATPTGVIRLGAPPTVCQGLLTELVARWSTDVTLELAETSVCHRGRFRTPRVAGSRGQDVFDRVDDSSAGE